MELIVYFSRKIDKNLDRWANSNQRMPLIIRGARQVGKSASISNLGTQFSSFVVVDFESSPELQQVFIKDLDPKRIIRELEALLEVRIIPTKTLLFFDEIQECPKAVASLRYFKEKLPELHIVAAGSLLEFILGDISFPVGRISYEYLYPLSFQEFLETTDRSILAEHIPKFSWQEEGVEACSEAISTKLYSALKEYFIVGGMPEAVAHYVETQSFLEVRKVHDRLIRGFRDDIPKYAKGDLQIRNVSQVFSKLAQLSTNQVTYTKLLEDDPKRNKNSVFLLEQAKLVHLVKSVSPAGLPLGASVKEKVFKSIFLDIGLMGRLCGRTAKQLIETDDLVSSFQGQLAEQFVGQQLLSCKEASEMNQLYFWQRSAKSSTAEVDYLIVREGKIFPLEVKSGSSGRLKSLHLLLNSYENVATGLCLQNTFSSKKVDNIIFCPLFTDIS